MAKQEFTCDDILKEIKAKQYRPIYYLMGEEPYYIDVITDFFLDNVLSETEKEFNLSVLYGADVDIGGLPLAIRHRCGNAVHVEAHAPHAKRGACAKAAAGYLQVLRVVLAVLDLQARHACQPFRQVDARLLPAHGAALDDVDRSRRLQHLGAQPCAGHHHRGQRVGLRQHGGSRRKRQYCARRPPPGPAVPPLPLYQTSLLCLGGNGF